MEHELINIAVDLMETGKITSAAELRSKMADATNLKTTFETLETEWVKYSRIAQETWDSYQAVKNA